MWPAAHRLVLNDEACRLGMQWQPHVDPQSFQYLKAAVLYAVKTNHGLDERITTTIKSIECGAKAVRCTYCFCVSST